MKNKKIDIEFIYNTYVDDLYSYAMYLGFDNEIVMDAIHDVFINLYAKKDTIDDIKNLKYYLTRSLKNTLINIYKSNQRSTSLHNLEETQEDTFDIEDKLISEENAIIIKEKIEAMLSILTVRQREIIYLRYVQEHDYNEIAKIMNITPGACRKLVHKAMQRLKNINPIIVLYILLI